MATLNIAQVSTVSQPSEQPGLWNMIGKAFSAIGKSYDQYFQSAPTNHMDEVTLSRMSSFDRAMLDGQYFGIL